MLLIPTGTSHTSPCMHFWTYTWWRSIQQKSLFSAWWHKALLRSDSRGGRLSSWKIMYSFFWNTKMNIAKHKHSVACLLTWSLTLSFLHILKVIPQWSAQLLFYGAQSKFIWTLYGQSRSLSLIDNKVSCGRFNKEMLFQNINSIAAWAYWFETFMRSKMTFFN